ncbi:E-selectin-like [Xyrauchen texanus]|uniref:E-selectin-like n=1 Tax=Xyrauchen texanus TaxID=154827 RepID=UPI00224227DB|nr:E-selectin-like [Xyrauchen texanus]
MVHNENVTHFLINYLPKTSNSHYWIGIKKIDGNWTWVANGQIADYTSWAPKEPNNDKSNENCVEMYTNNKNSGKWNDEGCEKKKLALCQKAQCLNNSCSYREDCFEQVNNFTCTCKPGLSGPLCETAVSCEKLSTPQHGQMNCSGFYGNHSLNSTCTFSCAGGYKLSGTAELKCNLSGAWNAPPPSCAVECYPLLLFGGGLMNCSEGNDTYRSTCRVQCPPGHLLLGFAEFSCRTDGTWVFSFPIMSISSGHFLEAFAYHCSVAVYYAVPNAERVGKQSDQGTRKRLVPEAAIWAPNEPNNQGIGGDCVEVYIKRKKTQPCGMTRSCAEGHVLNGASELICTFNGWTDFLPSCVEKANSSSKIISSTRKVK